MAPGAPTSTMKEPLLESAGVRLSETWTWNVKSPKG